MSFAPAQGVAAVTASVTGLIDMVGTDDANNTQSTASVVGNADGSVVERLEYLQTQLATITGNMSPGTFVPGLGFRVAKSEDMTAATGVDLFTVTGRVLLTLWVGEVTVAVTTNAADYKLRVKTANTDLCAATVLTSAAAGYLWSLSNDAGLTILTGSSQAVSAIKAADNNSIPICGRIVGATGGTNTLQSLRTASGAGTMTHTIFYFPLDTSAAVA